MLPTEIEELETAMTAYQTWGEWAWMYREDDERGDHKIPGIGTVRNICEPSDDDWSGEVYFVIRLTREDGSVVHLRKDGCYYSHDGYYWDGGFYPAVEKTQVIKVWERS